MRCPRQFKYIYIDKLKDEVGEAAQIGLDVHEYAENVANELSDQEIITENLILNTMLKLYPFTEEDFYNDYHAQSLYLFFVDALVTQGYKIFGVEGRVDDEDDQLRGIIDLVLEDPETEELFIIDYKTGKVKSISQFRLELCIYRKLIEHKYPNRKVASACIFFTKNASAGKHLCISRKYQIINHLNYIRKNLAHYFSVPMQFCIFAHGQETKKSAARYCEPLLSKNSGRQTHFLYSQRLFTLLHNQLCNVGQVSDSYFEACHYARPYSFGGH